ncbi:MAG: hypothetical protein IT540_13515 [Hyphomicrobium sp.]|nr:hypothetical protein [Hyphomicrobium sp.]
MSAGRLSLLAATGFLLVGGASAQAADLGGDCCADLEERIAELEATTARKGNRKVSLTVYGQVNEAIGYWDDGHEQNVYQYTNDASRTRIGFRGKAKISDDWFAEYRIEIGIRSEDQGALSADADDGGGGFDLRHSSWTLGSKTYGSVTVGETSMSHDGITQFQTANIGHFASPDIFDANETFQLRRSGGGNVNSWGNLFQVLEPGEGSRGSLVRYNTPTFAGFAASAHWGEDDIWGIALEYEGEIGPFEIAGGIGYGEMSERDEECMVAAGLVHSDCEEYGMSLSAMHKPSGIFVTGAYGVRKDNGRANLLALRGFAPDDELSFWHIQAGIEQKWNALGKTTIFGGYQDRDNGHVLNDNGGANISDGAGGIVTNSEMEMWEVGLNQEISAAAMNIYLHYKHYDADITSTNGSIDTEPWQTVIGGAIIKF